MQQDHKKLRRGAVLVALHALRPEIEAGLAARKPVAMIYDELIDRIPASYQWFKIYVAREITGTAGSRGGRVPGRLSGARIGPVSVTPAGQSSLPKTVLNSAQIEPPSLERTLGPPSEPERKSISGRVNKTPYKFGDLKIDLNEVFGTGPKKQTDGPSDA